MPNWMRFTVRKLLTLTGNDRHHWNMLFTALMINIPSRKSRTVVLESCTRYHCVCLVMTRRLICSMIYPGYPSDPPRSGLSSDQILKLAYRGQNTYAKMRLYAKSMMVLSIFLYFFRSKGICKKKLAIKKQYFLCFTFSGRVKM